MSSLNFESAALFTPGRASYVATNPDGEFNLHLTEASSRRAEIAAATFNPDFHTTALFAGGYPGIAQNWPAEHTPSEGNREADLMAKPLKAQLAADGWNSQMISSRVSQQGKSNNSIGDVLISVQEGLLNPDDFHQEDNAHGIVLVSGGLHAQRFRPILAKALDIDNQRISRVRMRDTYGTPATEFRPAEPAPVAVVKELAAIAITGFVLKNVKPGDIDALADAEAHFNQIVTKIAG